MTAWLKSVSMNFSISSIKSPRFTCVFEMGIFVFNFGQEYWFRRFVIDDEVSTFCVSFDFLFHINLFIRIP